MAPHQINLKCTSCEECVGICPTRSIFYGDGKFVINTYTCSDCKVCVAVCPEHAIVPIKDED